VRCRRLYDCIALHGPRRFLHDLPSAAASLCLEGFEMIDGYLMHEDSSRASLPVDYCEIVTKVQVVPDTLAACPLPLAPALAVHVHAIKVAE